MTHMTREHYEKVFGTGWHVGKDVPRQMAFDNEVTVAVAADVLPIPLTHRVALKTTGGDAEALSLADGFSGQMITIILATDGGGTGTLTPATSTGFATIVFADAGDQATLQFMDDAKGWIIIGLAGVSGPPEITV